MNLKNMRLRLARRFGWMLGDKLNMKIQYRLEMGKPLDLNNCVTMNEKLQWLKLYNRNPELTSLVDKIEVKKIIAEKIGSEYVIPTIMVWDSAEDITEAEIDSLPQRFVMKTNHSGGNSGVSICRNKDEWDSNEAIQKMKLSLKTDISRAFGEWPYKNVRRKIFAEEYLGDNIVDYKFYCFNGYVDVVLLCIGRQDGPTKFYFFDREWNLKRYNKAGKAAPEGFTVPKPEGIDKMFEIASELSVGFPFVRVDLYNVNGKIYFGEMTFFPASGFDYNRLTESDRYFGNLIKLPEHACSKSR